MRSAARRLGPEVQAPQASETEGQAEPRVARRTRLRVLLKGWCFSSGKESESSVSRSKFKDSNSARGQRTGGSRTNIAMAEPDSCHCVRI